ncbi:MAG: RagB/SusD family nutrient uptake outer membrane protein, partial [Cellulophaga sp.]
MKLIFNKITVILVTSLLAFSCSSDYFDETIQLVSEEEVLTSGLRSRGLIDDIYTDYAFNYFTDFFVENLTDNSVYNQIETDLATGYWGPTSNPYEFIWQQSYNNIRQIYQYIDLVHEAGTPYIVGETEAEEIFSDNTVRRYFGEAHFLKAWAQWQLLKVFGGLSEDGEMLGFPIVNEILENNDYATLSRNTYDECVTQILADLDVAIAYLPLEYSGSGTDNGFTINEQGRASGLAAYALKAKVALQAASPAFNITNDITKWELVATLAHDFIEQNGGLVSLQSFDYSRENTNSDYIWGMRTSRFNNSLEQVLYPPTLYGQGLVNPSQNLVDAFPTSNGYPITATESLYDASVPYSSRDMRFYRFIFYNEDKCYNSETCENFDALEIFDGGQDTFGGFIPNVGTRTGYYLKKFLNNLDFDPTALTPTTTLAKVYAPLTLEDMYLTYAEAVNEAYGQPDVAPAGFSYSAKGAIQRIRQRAGLFTDPYLDEVSTSQTDFRAFLKNERRIELCFTSERFNDLRRWQDIVNTEDIRGVRINKNADDTFTYNEIEVEVRTYENKNYYLPLPY